MIQKLSKGFSPILFLFISILFISNTELAFATPNTAPVLDASRTPALVAINEDAADPVGVVGSPVSYLVDFTVPAGGVDNVTDPDSGPMLGVAVTGIDSDLTCYYSVDSGSTWTAFGSVSDSSARLLAANGTNRIYCKAGANENGSYPAALTFRAWDQTSGSDGSTADVSTNGGGSAFSSASDTASLTVNAVNDAPVLDASKTPVLASMSKNAGAPTGAVGTLISSLIDTASIPGGVDNVTDVDSGALLGIAVIGVDAADLTCSYSLNGGATWAAMGSVSNSSARLLAADSDNRLYCAAGTGVSGTFPSALTFRAWDEASGSDGSTASAASSGGTTAFSSSSDTAGLTVSTNIAPEGTNLSASETYYRNAPQDLTDIVVSDADTATLTVTLTISNPSVGTLNTGTSGAVTSTYTSMTGVWSASGVISSLNTLLHDLTFTPITGGTSNFTITTSVSDGTVSVSGSKSVTFVPVPPNAPTAFSATAISPTEIHLSWTAPSDDGDAAITGYKIEREWPKGAGWGTLVANTGTDSTTYSDTNLQPEIELNYRVSAINSAGTGSVSDASSATTLTEPEGAACTPDTYWKFDEGSGTAAGDSSHAGISGTLLNGPVFSSDVPAAIRFSDPYSLVFNEGPSEKITFTKPVSNTFTVSMWIKPDNQADDYGSLISQSTDIGLYYMGSHSANANQISAYFMGADHFSHAALTQGTWHHIAWVSDRGFGALYVDGTLDSTASGVGPMNLNTLGSDPGAEMFDGGIDDVRVYDSALSAHNVSQIALGSDNCNNSAPASASSRHSSGSIISQSIERSVQTPPTTNTQISSSRFLRPLKLGAVGADVKQLQIFLNTHGSVISPSGPGSVGNETSFFGNATKAALKKFQEIHAKDILVPAGLKSGNGVLGPFTLAFLNQN
ncbi:MAG: LamG-like jellyroll fold domain-containing protein [Patescibacteria group bacterium]